MLGRGDELARVLTLLERGDVRMITLAGPGGAGKTRLAVEVARASRARFGDGVAFVDLSHVRDATLVPTQIAHTLHLRDRPGQEPLAALGGALAGRHLLLVLDNLEQVTDAAADIGWLLASCPHISVIATSRQPLHLRWEHVLRVPPLPIPGPGAADLMGYAAVALFVQRAQAVQPRFRLTDETAPAVIEICSRLDGLPLAIEIAAARSDVLSPPAILRRMARSLDVGGPELADLPERHRSLRSTIAWSYDLLGADDQALLRHLAVFGGSCTVAAAAAVEADESVDDHESVLRRLTRLADRSLLVRPGC